MQTINEEIDHYLRKLFPINRSLTGEGNRRTLEILKEIIPLNVLRHPSGQDVYGWKVPQEWKIRKASIVGNKGETLVDFQDNNLHVVSYSRPISQKMTWNELKPHVHFLPHLPDAIPYRTTYYKDDWGFCVNAAQYERLSGQEGKLFVNIDSELFPGHLEIGECLIPGKSRKEILISTYFCHPSMANDNLSGVILTALLARELSKRQDLFYSYRIVFVPETIGAICYCAKNEEILKGIVMGLIPTNVGGPGKFGLKQSFDSNHVLNKLVEEVFREEEEDLIVYPFDIHGSDERQYSSPGFRINCVTVSKDKYYEYEYYHTSLDNLSFVKAENIGRSFEIYCKLIDKIEKNQTYINLNPHCETMLSRYDLYPKTGGALLPGNSSHNQLDVILWLLFHTDGKNDLYGIHKKTQIPFEDLYLGVKLLEERGLVRLCLE